LLFSFEAGLDGILAMEASPGPDIRFPRKGPGTSRLPAVGFSRRSSGFG
jgi:hypothetical protein